MPVDFSRFTKMAVQPVEGKALPSSGRLVSVLVQLKEGAISPPYVTPRAWFGPRIFSTAIEAEQVNRLNSDPAVQSIEPGRPLTMID
jgi:hypothetical protein